MIERIPAHLVVDDDSFPYDFEAWNYPEELLRSSLYCFWWTEIPDDPADGNEYAIVMDYDGFTQWFNERKEYELMMQYDPDDCLPADTAEEYLPYHLGRTLTVVKVVSE